MRCSRPVAPKARAIPAIAVSCTRRTPVVMTVTAIAHACAGRRSPAVGHPCARRRSLAGTVTAIAALCGRRTAVALAVAGLVMAGAGCSSGGSGPHGALAAPTASQLAPPQTTCGTSHTAASVPVTVEVEKGSASCSEAMQIQNSYTTLVKSGQVGGNGGGAPVKVAGWTCQGTDTTTTVQTGEASECHKGTTEIVAVLKLQSSGSGS